MSDRSWAVIVKIEELDDRMQVELDVVGAQSEMEHRGALAMAREALQQHLDGLQLEEVGDEDPSDG